MIYIGIDPGLSGAVAVINEDVIGQPGLGYLVEVFDTPTMQVDSSGKVRNKYNAAAMAELLAPYISIPPYPTGRALVILESVHSMPKQGVASSLHSVRDWAYGRASLLPTVCHWSCQVRNDGRN